MRPALDPYAAAAVDLYARILQKGAVKGDGWCGGDVIEVVDQWLTSHGVDTDPADDEDGDAERGPCICEGRGGHTDPACPWFGTDTP